ncbi:MAG: ABC transporter ATP-binding protein, partial [Geminicoccaceae bacterium]
MPSVSEATSIRVEDLSVTYRTSLERKPTLRGTLLRMGRRERVVREIEAVKDVSFEVKHGQVSTLLALGVGFNSDLTGAENVLLGGLAAGLRKDQLQAKYDEIVEFA